ncbi:MAG: LPS assembly lipoprotein LptE [Pseudomonadota bacterium]
MHIAGGGSSLREEVTNVLTSSGARIASSRDDADAILRLSNEDRKERLLGVDPDTGKAREFELAYSVSFGLQDGSGKALVPTQRLRVVRDYVFDRDALIGKSRERGVLISEMRRDAALQLVRRLSE